MSDNSQGELSQKQQTALAELQRGATFLNAAQAAGVNRTTLYRWIKADPRFRAAYNAWEQAACESARARLVMAADSAVSKVVDCVRIDYKFAFKVLKELGIFHQRPAGQIDPDRVRQQIELEMKLPEPSDARVKRLASVVTASQPPQVTEMPAVLSEPNHAPQLEQKPARQLAPEELSVGACADLPERDDDLGDE